jgi:hypothetical protein
MLSDMDKEFVKQVVQQLCENCGIQHDSTVAYNPRTNGLTERFKNYEKVSANMPKQIL